MARRGSITALGQLAEAIALVSQGQPGHIVDMLIAERGQKIVRNPLWPVMRPFLYTLLRYNKAIEFANDISKLSGFQCFEYMSDLLRLDIGVTHADRIPASGGFILVSNHPTGIADGVAVFDLLKSCRPDMMVFANRDAVRVNPRFAEMIIPVEWRDEYKSKLKTRETLQLTNRAVAEGKVTVLFPSGRIAYWANGRLNERPWKTSAVGLARKYNLPILPVHLTASTCDLVAAPPTVHADVTLLLKTVTTIEQQHAGAAARLLSGLDSKHVVLSLPRKSLSGKRDYSDDASAIVQRALADGPYRLADEAAFGTESLYHLESSPR